MIELLLRDLEDAPHTFYLYGPIERERLETWWRLMPWKAPDELLLVWERIGGGDLLDGITLLGPFPQNDLQDGVEEYNSQFKEKGMSKDLFLFQISLDGYSAIEQKSGKILFSRYEDFSSAKVYVSMLSWYIGVVRSQAGGNADLRPIPEYMMRQAYKGW